MTRLLGPSFFATAASTGAAGGGGFSTDFSLLANNDPLSGVPGGWLNTANVLADDGTGSFTRGMRYYGTGYNVAYRDSGLSNGTFTMTMLYNSGVAFGALFARLSIPGGVLTGGVSLQANNSSGTWHIQITDLSNVLQVDYDTTVAFTNVTTYTTQLVLSGTSVIAKVGGVQAGVAQTDSWNSGGTYVGFGINGNGGTIITLCNSISAA